MDGFKVPQSLPQDVLLIHDIIGVRSEIPLKSQEVMQLSGEDCINSSDDGNTSEDEIEADLIAVNDIEALKEITESPDSSSESDTDLDDTDEGVIEPLGQVLEEEDCGPVSTTGTYFQTKNELVETEVPLPDIWEVGPEEALEKVGEIVTVMEKIVVIKSAPSGVTNRGSDRALDSDTLLVFDDRKVLGYIYETFGPTSQPLYQVRFNSSYPLTPEQLQISREVFHVPTRSRFVFLSQIKQLKGSDASNVHDEEPGDNELEFSDDEAEAAYKSSLKRKRGESRANSIALSRHSTPAPSQMHDQDMANFVVLNSNAYDEHGPYDSDFDAGSSRPLPIPYDDPYADEYTPQLESLPDQDLNSSGRRTSSSNGSVVRNRGRGHDQSIVKGKGRGRGRGGHSNHGRRGGNLSQSYSTDGTSWDVAPVSVMGTTTPYVSQPSSPMSLAIAGQLSSSFNHPTHYVSPIPGTWGYQTPQSPLNQPYYFGTQNHVPSIQPHINPRFASAFGMNMMNMTQSQSQPQPQSYDPPHGNPPPSTGPNWVDQWAVPTPTFRENGDPNS